MIWIVLAAIGVPLWLVVGVLGLSLWSRRAFRHRTEVFACRLRSAGPSKDGNGWPRGKRYAYWVHDVLLVHRGPALRRYEALPVASISGPVEAATAKGLGSEPMWLRAHLDDGRLVDVATHHEDVALATGPFVTATLM